VAAFELASTEDEVRLILTPAGPRAYSAALSGRDFNLVTTVHDPLGEVYVFPKFWEELATSWKGWSGEKSWCTFGGDIELTATCDRRGHVTIRCHLSSGAPEWVLTAWLHTESGALEALASIARRFADSVEDAV
jgi:hypothetical protein